MAIISTVAAKVTLALEEQGLFFPNESSLQFLTALLANRGAESYEQARKRGVPFVCDKPPPAGHYRPSEPQLSRQALIERAKGMLVKQEQRGQRPLADEMTREFQAQRIAATVIEQVKTAGLCVYTHKLLFSSEYAPGAGDKLLAGMYDEVLGTSSSCVAIGAGRLPPLPTRRLADHLRFYGPQEKLRPMPARSLSEWVAREKPYVIEFPQPDLGAGKSALLDRLGAPGHNQLGELGLGFILVAPQPHDLGYHVLTPMMFCSPGRRDGSEAGWRFETQSRVYRLTNPDGRQLTDLLKVRRRNKIVQLDACASCHVIFVREGDRQLRPDLLHRCACQA